MPCRTQSDLQNQFILGQIPIKKQNFLTIARMLGLFIAGFLLSLVGSLPPGLISLLVAYTAIQKGQQAAWWTAFGASVVEIGQAWLAAVAAGWFLAHPAFEEGFHWVVLPVFSGIGLYLLVWAPQPQPVHSVLSVSRWRQFLRGGLISLFNLLALPYWFAYCGWLHVSGWWQEGRYAVPVFAVGVGTGTLAALSLYVWAARKMVARSAVIGQWANRFIGVIFLLLAGKMLLELLF